MPKIRRKLTRTGAKPSKRTRKVILSDEQKAKRKQDDQALADKLNNITSWIVAPAGKPPYDLEGNDYDSVRDWVLKIRQLGNHTVQSCTYWVRYFYDINFQREDYNKVKQIIKENASDFGLRDLSNVKKELSFEDTKDLIIGE